MTWITRRFVTAATRSLGPELGSHRGPAEGIRARRLLAGTAILALLAGAVRPADAAPLGQEPQDSASAGPVVTAPPGTPTIGPQQATDTAAGPDVAPLPQVQPGAGDWAARIDRYVGRAAAGTATPRQGLALYDSLDVAIDAARADLARAIARRDLDGSHDRDARMSALYAQRQLLLAALPDTARVGLFRLTGTGLRQVLDELNFFWLHSRHELMVVRSTGRTWLARLINDPLGWVPGFLKVALAILVFLWWRRRVPSFLVMLRKRLLEIRPIRRQNVRLAKGLWYFERIHWPVEWLVMLTIVFNVTAAQNFGPALFVWAVAKWILIGWTAVLFIDALAARGAVARREQAGLRRSSLWMICWWVVAFALGRQLVRDFFGEGALFHWVSFALLLVLIPVAVTLVYWWRDEVFARLENDPNQTSVTRWLLGTPTGVRSYVTSALGGLYLLYDGGRRWFLRTLANSDVGRRALAQLSRSEIARQATKEDVKVEGTPIPVDTRRVLVGDGEVIDKVDRKLLHELVDLFESQPGSVALLTGSRGAGKSTVSRRLAQKLGDRAILVDCPLRSFDGLVARLGQAAGHPGASLDEMGALLAERDGAVVILDDIHRLGRPVIGGLEDIDHASGLVRAAGNGVSWLYTADSTAWQYLRRFREIEPLHNFKVVLQPWGEDEIQRLVTSRCTAADLDPDFSQLELPRQLDERSYDSPQERNRAGFIRVLWDDSGGNPRSALELWADSLVVTNGTRVEVRLTHPPGAGELDGLDPATLFVLRTIIRLEIATTREIADCLPLTLDEVDDVLQFARSLGIVNDTDGKISLSWRWDAAVNRALARRNMTE